MKVVLFCGGLGLRLREVADGIPKPMIKINHRPILWHVMKYYAHYGHKDFILCLGYRGRVIRDYFLNYGDCAFKDFMLSESGKKIDLANPDIDDWTITFVDTGMNSNIGQRLKAVEPYLKSQKVFLANYADILTDFPLPKLTDGFLAQDKVAGLLTVKPPYTFHVVEVSENSDVSDLKGIAETGIWINGGYMIFRQDIFKYMNDGDELVIQPFQRLIRENKLMAYKYDGFWACMDTFKEKQHLEDLSSSGKAPWKVWQPS